LPYREAMEQTERRLFDEYSRACTGVELLQTLQRAAQSPSERVRFWEKVIDWLPKIFEVKRLQEERVRVGRMSRADADANLAWQMRHVFPPGYALTTLILSWPVPGARCKALAIHGVAADWGDPRRSRYRRSLG
jgi:hypothetical protein